MPERRPRGVVQDAPPPPENYPQDWPAPDAPVEPAARDPRFNAKVTAILLALVVLAIIVIVWPRS